MATIKAYTDLSQSERLKEILPSESADMEYMFLKKDGSKVSNVPFVKDGFEEPECCYIFIPCWSLAALFSVLPEGTRLLKSSTGVAYHCDCSKGSIDKWYDNSVDAAFELIVKLHEQKLL
jgi:hypothetical protein